MNWSDYVVVGFVVCGLLAATLWDLLNKKTREHKQLLSDKESNISCKMHLTITKLAADCLVQKTEIEAQSFSQKECWQSYDRMMSDLKKIKNS